MTHLLNDNILLKKCLGYLLLARCVADMLPPRGDASLWEEVGLLHHLCPWKRNKVNRVYNGTFKISAVKKNFNGAAVTRRFQVDRNNHGK